MTLTALTSVLAGLMAGATGEAGSQMFVALKKLLRRSPAVDAEWLAEIEEAIATNGVDRAPMMAERLLEAANGDQALQSELSSWLTEARALIGSSVTNSISGPVQGNVIQAGVINTDSITQQ